MRQIFLRVGRLPPMVGIQNLSWYYRKTPYGVSIMYARELLEISLRDILPDSGQWSHGLISLELLQHGQSSTLHCSNTGS